MNIDPKMASILIVDDEPANVRLIEKILMTVGYTNVVGTQNAQEVLPLYQEHACDLILLDIDMPELDGFGVMQQLNIFTNGDIPPVLILTAQHLQSFRQRAFDLGARDYVTKPFDTGELLSRVRNLLEAQMAQKYMRHQNEILEKKILARTNELQDTRLQVVRRLGRAAEYRDNETGLHIIRMSTIASLLGEGTGMNSYDNDLLLNAASMHDIGKIGIPDHILLKKGKLSPEEWEIMKTHTQIGADILSGDDSDLMIMAHDVALTHHEKWNGEGYPNKIKGEDIPLVGRITALADVFDALTSARPYKKPWTLERAVELISSESGHHFDPDLVGLFMEKLPEIREINETYVEPEPCIENNKAWG
jgi:putative two-component system response regulator